MTSVIQNNKPTTSKTVKERSTTRVSAYSFFQKDQEAREKVKSSLGENPNFGMISKGMSEAWKALSKEERAKYEVLSEQAKASMPQTTKKTKTTKTTTLISNETETTSSSSSKKGTKPSTSTKKRKRARSAYTLFTMDPKVKYEVKTDYPDADFGALSKVMGGKWKTLSDSDKLPYQEASIAEKTELASQQPKTVSDNSTTNVKKRKRARSAYTLYSSDPSVREKVKSAHPEADFGALSKLIAIQWKELSSDDKTHYEEASATEKEKMAIDKLTSGEQAPCKVRKRARSAYTLYTMNIEVKSKVKIDHPDAGFSDFSKILASQWKALSDEDRQPYIDANIKEKEEMAANPPVLDQTSETKKPKQKRAKSAYTHYSSDPDVREAVKSANPDADFGTLSKLISAQWKALSAADRKPYDEKSQAEKDMMAAFKAANKPKKTRAKSAYLHYSMNPKVRGEAKNANPEMSVTELAKVLGAQWKALSAEERKPYEEAYTKEKNELAAAAEAAEAAAAEAAAAEAAAVVAESAEVAAEVVAEVTSIA
jgi:hypothetical protein